VISRSRLENFEYSAWRVASIQSQSQRTKALIAPRVPFMTKNSEILHTSATSGFASLPDGEKPMVLRIAVLLVVLIFLLPAVLSAHNVSKRDSVFVQSNTSAAVSPFMYLGAKHMVTGYDHLLFLVGVIFFLYKLKDIVQYVSLFTIGHSVTLLGGVLGGIHANPYLIDAIIGFSVVY